jgi:membrane-associated phospholipid phosphatase
VKASTYIQITTRIRQYPYGQKTIEFIDHILVGAVAVSYISLIVYLAVSGDDRLFKVILIPGISFLLTSILRVLINAPRPYEVFNFEPLINKQTHGRSFPSRHAFSGAIISTALFFVIPPLGIACGIVSVFIGIVRIISGVHFLRDVIGGLLFGVFCGIIGFWIL